jgi:hypothetical protein
MAPGGHSASREDLDGDTSTIISCGGTSVYRDFGCTYCGGVLSETKPPKFKGWQPKDDRRFPKAPKVLR